MRPTRHQMFLAMARAAASRATCYRLNVGAILVDDDTHNVIAIGYNGAPANEAHCTGQGCRYYTEQGCKVIHAEANAIERSEDSPAFFARLYVTHSPCAACVDLILTSGGNRRPDITEVYYETAYRDPSPVKTLIDGGVKVYRVLPSGMMIDESTGELCNP